MALSTIYMEQKHNLKSVEKCLESVLQASHSVLNEAALDLLRAGGKRIRPLLTLLCARYGDAARDTVIRSAAALELIHMASLVHDDVVDDSSMRRGKPTVKARWNNRVAMMAGDYMFAKAIEMIAVFENREVHLSISRVLRDLSLGEIDQIKELYHSRQAIRVYFRRIKRKTALLMALSCQLGALAAGCSSKTGRKLYLFGYYLGMSYQIKDDILDFTGSDQKLGKPAGSDLRNGNLTLPTLFALQRDDLRASILSILESKDSGKEEWDAVIQAIRASEAIKASEKVSSAYLHKGLDILNQLPQISVTHSLREIAEYIGMRKY